MKVCDVIHGRIASVDIRRVDGERFPDSLVPKAEVFLIERGAGELLLQMGEDTWPVAGVAQRDQDLLRQFSAHGCPRLCWFAQAVPTKGPAEHLLIQLHEFPSPFAWNEPVDIGIDDKIVDDMRRRRRRLVSAESVVQWLTETMLLHPRASGGDPRALLSGTPAPAAEQKTSFRLYGDGYAVDVERGTDDRLRITRVVEVRRAVEGDERRPIHLVSAQVRFCDATVAGQFRGVARTEIDNLVAQADSYLSLWREYNERERQAILRRANQFGWIAYLRREQLPEGEWRFHLQGDAERIAEYWQRLDSLDGEQIQAGVEVPAAIQGMGSSTEAHGPRKPFVGRVAGRHSSLASVDLRPPEDQEDRVPPDRGFLFVSLGGDEIRIARRRDAWERIRSCTNPMPQIGMMIEGRPVPEQHVARRDPRKSSVRAVFANPNDRQWLALDVALNTPDIALVQGPPGTGKTRVIAALQARLAEQDEGIDPDGLAGNTLLTSFQHDAVENAAAATRVMGLPAVKVGFRRGNSEVRDGVAIWVTETIQAVRAARAEAGAEATIRGALQALRELAIAYIQSPGTRDEPAHVLRRASELAGPWLPGLLASELAALRSRISLPGIGHVEDEDRAFALQATRAIRVDHAAFSDDGPSCAYRAVRRIALLEGFEVTAEERATLEEAASCPPETPVTEELLARLRSVRDALVDRLQPRPPATAGPRTHADVEDMLVRVVDAVGERAKEMAPGVDAAVEDWLAALENDPEGLRDTVQHYSMVLAATCQQSVSRAMGDAKLGDDTIFRSVVVDEAARANPLDLLIPMAIAERRIVLVGDHRQLPHVLEPDIERELERSAQEETRSALRSSLFERLFTELREREARDGIKRTVTLNVQYRMHPVLGQFVSQQFYEPHGEGFTSGRDEDEFAHTVALTDGASLAGKVAAWIDVPRNRGAESHARSKSRSLEAARIAREVNAVVTSHPELSVGVISFYAAQRDLILARMADADLTEPDDTGSYRVRDRWQRTADGRERLRVGTVDAFQGKEFDVVFLSLTRSNNIDVTDEVTRRRRYGFLLLDNRLCVAMSRQHRLLIIVGDPGMVTGPDADSSVPGLVAFRRLCEGAHGAIVRS